MILQLELWQMLVFSGGLLMTFLGGVWAIAKFILSQFEARMNEKFNSQATTIEQEKITREQALGEVGAQLRRVENTAETRKSDVAAWNKQIEETLTNYRERLSRLEESSKIGPTHEDLGDLHERINGIADDVSNLSGEFAGARRTLDLIHSFLLNGGKS